MRVKINVLTSLLFEIKLMLLLYQFINLFNSKSNEQENKEEFPNPAALPLLHAVAGIKTFIDAVDRNQEADKFLQFKKPLEQIR